MKEKYKQNAIKLAELLNWKTTFNEERNCTYWIDEFDKECEYTIIQLIMNFTSYNELFKILCSMPENWDFALQRDMIFIGNILDLLNIRYGKTKILSDEEYIYELQNACIYYLEHKND